VTVESNNNGAYAIIRELAEDVQQLAHAQQIVAQAADHTASDLAELRGKMDRALCLLGDANTDLQLTKEAARAASNRTETISASVQSTKDKALTRKDVSDLIKLGGAHSCPFSGAQGNAASSSVSASPWYNNKFLLTILLVLSLSIFIAAGGQLLDLKEFMGTLKEDKVNVSFPLDSNKTTDGEKKK